MNLKGIMTSLTCEWATPQWLFDAYDNKYHFTLDPCSTHENAKCEKHYTIKENGLVQDWGGESVWMNPPYGHKATGEWVKKAYHESLKPNTLVVCLLPSRTDTKWFHDYCLKGEITFIKGRLQFGDAKRRATFPSIVVVFDNNRGHI